MICKDEEFKNEEHLWDLFENGENHVKELLIHKSSKKLAQKYAKYLHKCGKTIEDIDEMFDNMGGGMPYETLVNVKEEFLKLYN